MSFAEERDFGPRVTGNSVRDLCPLIGDLLARSGERPLGPAVGTFLAQLCPTCEPHVAHRQMSEAHAGEQLGIVTDGALGLLPQALGFGERFEFEKLRVGGE